MKALAKNGADAFYEGEIADAIADAVQGDPAIAGDMTATDLAAYDVVEREPVCLNYRGYDVCGMGPPSSGALAVGQILGILENFDLGTIASEGGRTVRPPDEVAHDEGGTDPQRGDHGIGRHRHARGEREREVAVAGGEDEESLRVHVDPPRPHRRGHIGGDDERHKGDERQRRPRRSLLRDLRGR